jgi:NAD(P)-dependent dehydrogenase (short-subunit alcohol dehydrogenase family)
LLTQGDLVGIGAAVAKAFARSGCYRIAITDIKPKSLDETANAILQINSEAQVLSKSGDISDETFVNSLSQEISDKFARVDYAVNCAGILGESLRSTETSVSAFDLINRVNYRGTWLSSRAALALMLKQPALPEHPQQTGAIVNIASQLGVVARPSAGKVTYYPFISSGILQLHELTRELLSLNSTILCK